MKILALIGLSLIGFNLKAADAPAPATAPAAMPAPMPLPPPAPAPGSVAAAPAPVKAKSKVMGRVFFLSPRNGATVKSPLKIKMGVSGMKVCEANKPTDDQKCGHHHLLIDSAFIPEGQAVPKDETHIHYGQKQTAAEITLTPGKHTLTLQFADYAHMSYGEKLSKTITVNVK